MLGDAREAEDIVQDAWLRWQGTPSAVENPPAFLATVVTRLSLTALDSARARRETYVGPWLPEPVGTADDPLLGAERAEVLSLGVLVLLERLSPAERAAFVLHEAFDYPFRDIAEVLDTTEANARQLARRARLHVDSERRAVVSPAQREQLLARLVAALESGDLAELERHLAADVRVVSDGGGVVTAARVAVEGRARVATFLLGIVTKQASDVVFRPVWANGHLSLLGLRGDTVQSVTVIDFEADQVSRVYIVMNPAKLSRW